MTAPMDLISTCHQLPEILSYVGHRDLRNCIVTNTTFKETIIRYRSKMPRRYVQLTVNISQNENTRGTFMAYTGSPLFSMGGNQIVITPTPTSSTLPAFRRFFSRIPRTTPNAPRQLIYDRFPFETAFHWILSVILRRYHIRTLILNFDSMHDRMAARWLPILGGLFRVNRSRCFVLWTTQIHYRLINLSWTIRCSLRIVNHIRADRKIENDIQRQFLNAVMSNPLQALAELIKIWSECTDHIDRLSIQAMHRPFTWSIAQIHDALATQAIPTKTS